MTPCCEAPKTVKCRRDGLSWTGLALRRFITRVDQSQRDRVQGKGSRRAVLNQRAISVFLGLFPTRIDGSLPPDLQQSSVSLRVIAGRPIVKAVMAHCWLAG